MQSVIPSWSRLSTWFLLPQPGMEEDKHGELVPAMGTGSPAGRVSPACCLWASTRCCLSLFHCCASTISSAAGVWQLEVCWWFQFGSKRWKPPSWWWCWRKRHWPLGSSRCGGLRDVGRALGCEVVAFPFYCPLLTPFLCFLSTGRVQVAEGFALSVAACVLRRQLSQNQSFSLLWVQRKNLEVRL